MINPVVNRQMPVVSVVIPLYQKVRHIAAAICVAYALLPPPAGCVRQ